MAILDKLSGMAKNLGDKAGGAIETTKLNSKINSEKSAIDGAMKKIGEFYYVKHQSGEVLEKEAAAWCNEIDEHNITIKELKAEIERIKTESTSTDPEPAPKPTTDSAPSTTPCADDSITCPSCGKQSAAGTRFCQQCGTNLVVEKPETVLRICQCGAEVAIDAKFCGECGTKF